MKEPTALWIFPEGASSLQTGCVQPCSHVPVILVGLSQFRVCCLESSGWPQRLIPDPMEEKPPKRQQGWLGVSVGLLSPF